MKFKANRACDLNTISVFPPQSRRLSATTTGTQASQPRSQHSQQSFSQGISSQHGMLSQLSQTSLDEGLINDQRIGSQERENSAKKPSCLPPIIYSREESQMPMSRSSTNVFRKWNPASFQDYKCQVSEELERRIGMMETSLNKLGMILDSVQSDVMQVNKGTKEVSMEVEGMRQKLFAIDSSVQQMKKGQEEMKNSLDESLKFTSEKLTRDLHGDKLEQISLMLSALPEQMEASHRDLQKELQMTFSKEMQAMACNLETTAQKSPSIITLSPKVAGCHAVQHMKKERNKNLAYATLINGRENLIPKVETGSWKSVRGKATSIQKPLDSYQKPKTVPLVKQESEFKVTVESDEDIDEGFSFLIDDKETGMDNYMIEEAKEETERILRKARRRKRKIFDPIIIN
ncbi:hypothetical protein K2173_013442 [Erythroxylum novogranatense]|uniref:Protein PAIR1 n=1 Tax=Erythroxylum novogranatense TaxID=1862640 RepID=A0AAV8S9W2_9ROSI|nr:hypothetical protein K2173_013442 [Erythroxylum novogranatense]